MSLFLVKKKTNREDDKLLAVALGKIQRAGLTLNKEKCQFSKYRITFLGQIIDGSGVYLDPDKVSAIRKIGTPEDVSDLLHFLRMYIQLIKFVPNLTDETKPLRDLLRRNCPWMRECSQQDALEKLTRLLFSTPVLALYDPDARTTVSTDVSRNGFGAVLLQEQANGDVKPVSCISRSLSPTEKWYVQIEREALAFTWACECFSDFLVGLKFSIQTDHKPLISLFSTKHLEELPDLVHCFRLRILRFDFNIVCVPGKNLVIADALSRAPLMAPHQHDQHLEEDVQACVDVIFQDLPVTERRLEEI